MNPEVETKGDQPESENQTVNEEKSEKKPVTMKLLKLKDSQNPLRKGEQFRFKGVIFEVYDQRQRGRAFVRMLGIPVYVDENGREVING
jgi:hypothetical protein